VIDDDEGHAESLADALELEDYACVLASSGEQGVERMRDGSFDAVLTDLVMRGKTGLEVLEEAKTLQPETPVLLITGHATVESAVDAMRRGAEDYLQKPVNLGELRAKLKKAVDRARLARRYRELEERNVHPQYQARDFMLEHDFEGFRLHDKGIAFTGFHKYGDGVVQDDLLRIGNPVWRRDQDLVPRAKQRLGNIIKAVFCSARYDNLIP